ncbi:hypothetical protein EV361DRAFT_888240 [Lentinula raphanica]|uniref:RNase III domain-containing protein n=1 Tax=Lentinula raphanica TaxID=153919 RepID=A0AA38PGL2_9AGAR|nr:hypothetical protein F5880DRAFT_1714008 [Lentinula raphanica]KAJ3842572.1 hypothetical protein F5878DRAFT_607289 [Lentinula raphanica]KAJ3975585.1 hypothetical protein EV361DRAFT_888240 [Lentinula raphanica]
MAPDHDYLQLQKKVLKRIEQAEFDFSLPTLSRQTWKILINDNDERERLEFVGDFYMAAAVGESLCHYLPDGSPRQYTVARSALTSNLTYSAIMNRLGLANPSDGRKTTADAFESIIGAKKKEDVALLDTWFETYYVQLIKSIVDDCRQLPHKGKKAAKPHQLHSIARGSRTVKKRHISLSPRRVQKQDKAHPIKSPTIYSRHCQIIDLVVDSDSEDDDDVESGDVEIVQISSAEIKKSRTNISAHQTITHPLGSSINPIVID